MRFSRQVSSQAARRRLTRMLCLPGARRMRLLAMCLMVAKLGGALSRRMRHSSSIVAMSGPSFVSEQPRRQNNSGRLPRRARRTDRRICHHGTAFPSQRGGAAAKNRASSCRTRRSRLSFRHQPAQRARTATASPPAGIRSRRSGADLRPPRNVPTSRRLEQMRAQLAIGLCSSSDAPRESEDHHRFGIRSACHAQIHPIALTCLRLCLTMRPPRP